MIKAQENAKNSIISKISNLDVACRVTTYIRECRVPCHGNTANVLVRLRPRTGISGPAVKEQDLNECLGRSG